MRHVSANPPLQSLPIALRNTHRLDGMFAPSASTSPRETASTPVEVYQAPCRLETRSALAVGNRASFERGTQAMRPRSPPGRRWKLANAVPRGRQFGTRRCGVWRRHGPLRVRDRSLRGVPPIDRLDLPKGRPESYPAAQSTCFDARRTTFPSAMR